MAAAARHVEKITIPGRRLGWKPRDPNREVLGLSQYLTGTIPDHPQAVDYFTRVGKWLLGRNDEFSTCGPTSVANLLLLVSTWLANTPIRVTDNDIIDLYRRSGNPDFDPITGQGDNGVDMTVMLSAAIQGGIGGYYPLGFAAVNGNNPDEVWAASALFGGTLWGADLDVAQQHQTDVGVWDYTPSADWGGHAVLAAGRYSNQPGTLRDRTGLVSWAHELDSTDRFITRQVRERYVVIWPWHLGSTTFQRGVDLTTYARDYQQLTDRPFPTSPLPTGPVPPAPAPDPGNEADRALIIDLGTWPTDKHIGANAKAATAVQRWKKAKNL